MDEDSAREVESNGSAARDGCRQDRKRLVVWGNCQSEAIKYGIEKYHAGKIDLTLFSNYTFIQGKLPITEQLISTLKSADIFAYQNQSYNIPPHDLPTILGYLDPKCAKVCFPTLHSCHLQFGYETHDPKNAASIGEGLPFGKFYYGVPFLAHHFETAKAQGDPNPLDKVLQSIARDDLIPSAEIDYWKERTLSFLEDKCKTSDIPELFDFVVANYQQRRLWHNPNHPTGVLLNELARLIFAKIGLDYPASDGDAECLDRILRDWVIPIFPCVKARLGLTFPTERCSSWYCPQVTDVKSYVETYIREFYV